MLLFDKKKDFIFKITNLILLLWFLISLTVFYINTINLLVPNPVMDYDEYKVTNCYYYAKEETEDLCEQGFVNYKLGFRNDEYNRKRSILNSAVSIFISLSALYLLNKKDRKSDK